MMRNLNRSFILIAFLGMLVFGSHGEIFGKNNPLITKKQADLLKKESKAIERGDLVAAAALATEAGTDHGLNENYCFDDASFIMTPTFYGAELTGGSWKGAPDEPWVDSSTGEFIPSNVPVSSLGNFISVTYVIPDAMGVDQEFRDYTKVQALPGKYTLSGPNELCDGDNIQLELDGSDGNAMYYLMRDPDLDGPLGSVIYGSTPGTGSNLSFNVSVGGRYTIEAEQTYVDANCRNVMTGIVDVTVHSLPIPTASNDSPKCEGGNVVLTGGPSGMSSYSWTGPNGYSSSIQSPTINNISTSGNGIYTISVVDNNGCSANVTTNVVVNSNPTITASSNSPICEGSNINLSSVPAGGSGIYTSFSWSGPNGFTGSSQAETIVGASTAATGDYFVTVTDDSGCSSDGSVFTNVNINTKPTIVLSYNDPVCLNTTLTLTATPSGGSGNYVNYYWTKDGSVISGENSATLIINSASLSDEGTYGVSVEDNSGCISDEITQVVVIRSLPVASASNNGPLCVGEDLNLSGGSAGMVSYEWSGPNGWTNNTDQNPVINNVDVINSGTYSLVVTDANTCQQTITTDVVVNQVNAGISVSAPAPGLTTICAGTSVTFNASAADGSGIYTYDFHLIRGGVDNSVQNGSSSTFVTPSDNLLLDQDKVYVVVTDANTSCTDVSESMTMNVKSNPVPELKITSSGENVICLGSNVNFLASPSTYDRYVFIRNATETLQDGASNTLSTDQLLDGDMVTVTAYAGSCSATPNPITMSVYDLPSATLVADKTTVCDSEEVTFKATPTGTGPFTYQFYVDGTSQGIQASDEFKYSSTNNFTVYVEVYDGNNCNAPSSPIDITISKPVATLTADKTTICDTEEVTFKGTGGVTYEFFVNALNAQGPGASDEYKTSTLANNDIVSVKITDAIGCIASSSGVPVTVNPIPVVSLTSSDIDNTICSGDTITFTATGGDIYTFYVDGAEVPSSNGKFGTRNLTDGQVVTALVSYSSSGCSTLSSEITTTVNSLPIPTLSVSPSNTVISGTPLSFTAGGGTEYEFSVNSGGNVTIIQSRSSDNTYDTSTGSYVPVDGDIVTVDVYDGNSCSSSTSINLTILDGILPLDVLATATEYCEGDGGVSVYLANPQDGITYELFRTSDNAQEGASIMFDTTNPLSVQWDNILGDDEYRVEAYYASVPAERLEMNNRITVKENLRPTVFDLTPTGSVTGCNGGAGHVITLDDSETGVDYHLQLEGTTVETLSGTDGNPIVFSAQLGIGTYTITAENATSGCTKDMTGTLTINGDGSDVAFNLFAVNPADPLDPTDGRYCAGGTGVEIGLDGSLDNTVNYKLYLDGADTGVSIPGTNGVISFGSVTAEGSYTVRVESSSGCQFPMAGNVDVSIVPNPTAFNVLAENDGHYCAGEDGVNISVDDQEEGVAYILFFNNTTPLDTVMGTNVSGTPILFDGPFASEGTYTVEAVVPDVECSRSMNNSVQVVIDPLPVVYDAYNDDAQFCTGESTIIYINESEADVEYNWYEIDNGVYGSSWKNGNGSRLDFEINSDGTYMIIGRKTDGVTSCESTMNNGPFVITEKQLPQQKFLAKDPASILDCSNGLIIQVVSSEVGVSYTLVKYEGGVYYPAANIPSVVGDGTDISFLPIVDTNDAVYTVEAVKNGCSLYLTDTVKVNIIGVIEKQTVTGSGEICNGDPGVSFGLADTESGVTYELWKVGDSDFVESIIGDGDAITYSPVGEEGEYYVMGRSTSCDLEMANRVVLNVNPLPVSFPMFGSGQTCDVNNDGALLGLVGSEVNYNYTLQFDDGSGILDNLTVIPGHITNDSLKYVVYQEGTYTFLATTDKGCTSSMNSEVVVVEKTQPVDVNIVSLSNDTYCEGEDGIYVQLENNENNVTYQIIDENGIVISEVIGTNMDINTPEVIDFPQALSEGIYTVWSSRGGDACVNQINNNKEIVINLATSPTEHNLVVDNAKVCGNISPVISLEDSEPGRQYRLEADGIAVNDTLTSVSGEAISWNVTESVSGDVIYEVIAMSGNTCDLSMGMIDVAYNDVPSDFKVNTNDLVYCEGGDNIEVSIENTQQDVAYFLVDTIDIENVLDVLIGNGSDQTFTKNIGKGGYTVTALLYETGCKVWYNDTLEIKESLLPTVNRDVFCGSINEPECTVEDALCIYPTESDVNYQLYDSDGVLVDQLVGDGDKLCFKAIDEAGDYSIIAVSGNYPYCENSFDNGGSGSFEFGNKDFGSLVAFDDTLNIANNIQVDTVSVRKNDNLIYVVAGESKVIPYTEGGYFSSDDPSYLVIDKYWKDYSVTINPEITNIRFRLLDIDKDGEEHEVESVSNKYVGVYTIDTITGELTLNKIPGFYGKDKIQYVVSNIDEELNKSIERRDTATVYVYVGNEMIAEQKSFIIPNAFSPNGDGINDLYIITGIEGNGISAEKSNLEVFNRWGTLVYRSKGIKYGQDNEWWDGKSTTANMVSIGSDLPNGTYFYVFSVEVNEDGDVKRKEYNGYVELRR